jgi:uncharacterized protein (DUF58 family)
MKTVGLVALCLGTLLAALIGGWSVTYHVAYTAFLLVLVAGVWAVVAGRTMSVERRMRAQRAEVGGYFEEWVAVDNTWLLPKPWVELESDSTLSGHAIRRGFFLGPGARRSWTLRTQCTTRGKFTLGDVVVSTGDPFGLFQRKVRFPSTDTIVVYPQTVDFTSPARIPGDLPGGARPSGHVPYMTPTAAGVREYAPSDPLSRIHWPTTARLGRLMVKEFELDPFADVWIALDLNRYAHFGRGAESTEEYAVTIAASLGKHFLMQNRSVGFLAQNEVIQADRGSRQLTKLLELLAVVRSDRWQTLAETLSAESVRFKRLSTVVVVTPSTTTDWVVVCQHLTQRGVNVMVALVESSTFGSGVQSIDVVGSLAAANIPVYLVKRGEPLDRLLAEPAAQQFDLPVARAANGG